MRIETRDLKPGPPYKPSGQMDDSAYGWRGDVPAHAVFVQPHPVTQFDAELGQIFIQMRTLLGLSLWDMARAVGGEPPVVANLEAGALGALPPWPELARLIDAYAGLTGIDPQPITARFLRVMGGATANPSASLSGRVSTVNAPPAGPLMGQAMPNYGAAAERSAVARARPVARPMGSVPPPVVAPRSASAQQRLSNMPALAAPAEIVEPTQRSLTQEARRAALSVARGFGRGVGRGMRQWSLMLIVLFVLPALLAIVCRLVPGVAYAAISPLPGPVYRPVRLGLDHVVVWLAPVRDGLTWIDVGDPQLRKSGRLLGKIADSKR